MKSPLFFKAIPRLLWASISFGSNSIVYSTILDEPQDCPWTYLESFPVDDTIELYWDNFEGEETRGGRNTDTYTLSLENLN